MFLHPLVSPLSLPPRGGTRGPINPPPNSPNLLSVSCLLPPLHYLKSKGSLGRRLWGAAEEEESKAVRTPLPQAGQCRSVLGIKGWV